MRRKESVGRDSVADADLVELECVRRKMLQRVDVNPVLRMCNRHTHRAGPNLQEVRTAGQHLVFVHPDHVCLELVSNFGWRVTSAHQVAATRVDLVGERDRDRLACDRNVEISVHCDDAINGAGRACGKHPDGIAGLDRAPDDST